VFEKLLNPKAVINMKRKSRSQIRSFRLNPQNKRISNMLVGLKIPNNQNLFQNRNSIIDSDYRISVLEQILVAWNF